MKTSTKKWRLWLKAQNARRAGNIAKALEYERKMRELSNEVV